ncbi:FMN-binding negative transcriptional regulator [Actinomyces howellii]|uniref:Protease synthase and sporulation protein PAI 2 n=1 Tax=Actinomyces howellii TaxID=52771 RepID=A0A448HDR0_9ACTO|nr:FMN-binding negative transcriptional regulator [Actinomyces howellii]VEG26023.1 Protease synthase and sporulation protein PAI 2 [Actinomyces howellii]
MYVPQHFELGAERTRALLVTPGVGNLVTVHDQGPLATLVPFYLDESRDVLVTHLVRNNPQVREPMTGPGMVLLDDVDAYVAPAYYATNEETPNVPTWDYVTVHVWGPVHVDPSPQRSLEVAQALTQRMEREDVLTPVGRDKLERMARAIVAVEVGIERVQGKAKMSQNRHPDDVRSLIDHMERLGEHDIVRFLQEVSLPYAEARFATIARLRGARSLEEEIRSFH